jgi:hypothetical protein
LRKQFLEEKLFEKEVVLMTYMHNDRLIIGGAYPVEDDLKLEMVALTRVEKGISGNRVIPASSPGMATEDSLDGKNDAFYYSVLLKRLYGIFGTGRNISARCRGERRDTIFIEVDRQ